MSQEGEEHNFAFIDGQNLYKGVANSGWELDYYRLRFYLSAKYSVKKAYIFLGYLKENEKLYSFLRDSGFELVFKNVAKGKKGEAKGNVDVALAVFAMKNLDNFDKAIIITSDGDFEPLVDELQERDKLHIVVSVKRRWCSHLLKKSAAGKIVFLDELKDKVRKTKKRPADR